MRTATITAKSFTRVYRGDPSEMARMRHDVADLLKDIPRSDDAVLVISELARAPDTKPDRPSISSAGLPGLFQPAVVGVGAGDEGAGDVAAVGVTAGDAGPVVLPIRGVACVRAVVVIGPAELPFSQDDQDFCQ